MKQIVSVVNKIKNYLVWSIGKSLYCIVPLLTYTMVYADDDPVTGGATWAASIIFGTLGLTISSIIIGATFVLAKLNKVQWERFVTVAICVSGFFGAPSIASILYGKFHH